MEITDESETKIPWLNLNYQGEMFSEMDPCCVHGATNGQGSFWVWSQPMRDDVTYNVTGRLKIFFGFSANVEAQNGLHHIISNSQHFYAISTFLSNF